MGSEASNREMIGLWLFPQDHPLLPWQWTLFTYPNPERPGGCAWLATYGLNFYTYEEHEEEMQGGARAELHLHLVEEGREIELPAKIGHEEATTKNVVLWLCGASSEPLAGYLDSRVEGVEERYRLQLVWAGGEGAGDRPDSTPERELRYLLRCAIRGMGGRQTVAGRSDFELRRRFHESRQGGNDRRFVEIAGAQGLVNAEGALTPAGVAALRETAEAMRV